MYEDGRDYQKQTPSQTRSLLTVIFCRVLMTDQKIFTGQPTTGGQPQLSSDTKKLDNTSSLAAECFFCGSKKHSTSTCTHKTSICEFWPKRRCKFSADECGYAHGSSDLRKVGDPPQPKPQQQMQSQTVAVLVPPIVVKSMNKRRIELELARVHTQAYAQAYTNSRIHAEENVASMKPRTMLITRTFGRNENANTTSANVSVKPNISVNENGNAKATATSDGAILTFVVASPKTEIDVFFNYVLNEIAVKSSDYQKAHSKLNNRQVWDELTQLYQKFGLDQYRAARENTKAKDSMSTGKNDGDNNRGDNNKNDGNSDGNSSKSSNSALRSNLRMPRSRSRSHSHSCEHSRSRSRSRSRSPIKRNKHKSNKK